MRDLSGFGAYLFWVAHHVGGEVSRSHTVLSASAYGYQHSTQQTRGVVGPPYRSRIPL